MREARLMRQVKRSYVMRDSMLAKTLLTASITIILPIRYSVRSI